MRKTISAIAAALLIGLTACSTHTTPESTESLPTTTEPAAVENVQVEAESLDRETAPPTDDLTVSTLVYYKNKWEAGADLQAALKGVDTWQELSEEDRLTASRLYIDTEVPDLAPVHDGEKDDLMRQVCQAIEANPSVPGTVDFLLEGEDWPLTMDQTALFTVSSIGAACPEYWDIIGQ